MSSQPAVSALTLMCLGEVIICGPLLPGLPALGTFLYLGLAAPGTKMYLGLAALGTKMYLGLAALGT